MNKYVLLCNTETTLNGTPTHVYTWSSTVPTVCPNDSGHTIDISTITVTETRNPEKKISFTPKNSNIKNSTYKRIGTEIFLGSSYATAKAISYMDSSVTSYDIEIFDKDNKQVLLTKNLTNTEESIQDLGVLSNLPLTPTHVEISVKKNGGNGNSNIYIENVIICYN